MFRFLLPLLTALSFPAFAQTTITLNPAPCGAGVWCPSVPNDSVDNILLFGSTNYQDVGVILTMPDGSHQTFSSPNYRGYSTIYHGTCLGNPAVGYVSLGLNGNPVPMTGPNGAPATITAVFTCTTYQGGSGRGNGPHQVWTLTAGTISF